MYADFLRPHIRTLIGANLKQTAERLHPTPDL